MTAASCNLQTVLLQENIAARDWDKVRQIAREVAGCVQHVHGKDAQHGDIKPLNIMRTAEGRYLLIDLDASVRMGEPVGAKKRKTNRGTKGQKYRMTGDQKAAARRQDDHGDRGGGSGGGGLSQLGGS